MWERPLPYITFLISLYLPKVGLTKIGTKLAQISPAGRPPLARTSNPGRAGGVAGWLAGWRPGWLAGWPATPGVGAPHGGSHMHFWPFSLRKSISFDPKTHFFGPATRALFRLAAGGKVCQKRAGIFQCAQCF